MTILHIVPSHYPKADVALTLAKGLRESHQMESLFYSTETLDDSLYSAYNFKVLPPTLTSLADDIPKDIKTILLHVSDLTYSSLNTKAKKNDFIQQLENILSRGDVNLITIFHEIPDYNRSPIFFVKNHNQTLTNQLANLSLSVITNNHLFELNLSENTNAETVCINNFSRAGELQSHNLLGASRCNLVILGGYERVRIYKNKAFFQQVTEALKLDQIVDIGPDLNWSKINTTGLKIQKMGPLMKNEISDQLTIAKVGILDYSRYPGCLGKSSVFNAYKAHGVAPLVFKNMDSIGDNIIPGINYFTAQDIVTLKSNRSIARMAHTNYSRYQSHNKKNWVQLIHDLTQG